MRQNIFMSFLHYSLLPTDLIHLCSNDVFLTLIKHTIKAGPNYWKVYVNRIKLKISPVYSWSRKIHTEKNHILQLLFQCNYIHTLLNHSYICIRFSFCITDWLIEILQAYQLTHTHWKFFIYLFITIIIETNRLWRVLMSFPVQDYKTSHTVYLIFFLIK